MVSAFHDTQGWQLARVLEADNGLSWQTASATEAYYPALNASGLTVYSDNRGDLWVQRNADEAPTHLNTLPQNCGHPDISADGQRLVCVCFQYYNRSEDSELYWVDLNSNESAPLIPLPGIQKYPTWTRDGTHLVFSTGYRERGEVVTEDLWIMSWADRVPERIVANGGANIQPAVSPDDQWIAFASDVSGSMDLWLYNRATKRARQVSHTPAMESDPTWIDNRTLAFLSTAKGAMSLWTLNIDDLTTTMIAQHVEDLREPAVAR